MCRVPWKLIFNPKQNQFRRRHLNCLLLTRVLCWFHWINLFRSCVQLRDIQHPVLGTKALNLSSFLIFSISSKIPFNFLTSRSCRTDFINFPQTAVDWHSSPDCLKQPVTRNALPSSRLSGTLLPVLFSHLSRFCSTKVVRIPRESDWIDPPLCLHRTDLVDFPEASVFGSTSHDCSQRPVACHDLPRAGFSGAFFPVKPMFLIEQACYKNRLNILIV